MQKTNQKEFRIEKVLKRKGDKLYVKWKGYNSSFNSWINKKDLVWFYHTCLKTLVALQHIKMNTFYPEPYELFGGDINVTVDLSNYATKTDLKNVAHVDTSCFALKTSLANLKT